MFQVPVHGRGRGDTWPWFHGTWTESSGGSQSWAVIRAGILGIRADIKIDMLLEAIADMLPPRAVLSA